MIASWAMAAGLLLSGAQTPAQPAPAGAVDEARIEQMLSQMTLMEKIAIVSGASSFGTAAIPRLGVRSMRFADGPNGVRSNDGDEATAFPTGITLASSWNPALVQQVGRAMGEETRAMRSQVLLGPNLNLVRSPLSGRNFETYGEDPFLAGSLGVGFVEGVQSAGVAVSVKHYVGNEQETERNRGNSIIDQRALHELYLKPFEMAVKQAKPWTLMTAYNRTNGVFMSENAELVRKLLKGTWGFDGVVMSDWGGTHSTTALAAGLDLEMPGPPLYFGESLRAAVTFNQVSRAALDDAARRMLRLSARVGALDYDFKSDGEISTRAHRELARTAAAQGITLLKNENSALPLELGKLRTLAVIGPNADAVVMEGGGSAQVLPSNIVSPLDAIKALVGSQAAIRQEQGVDNELYTPSIDGRDLSPDRTRKQHGLTARYYANEKFAGAPVKTRVEQNVGAMLMGDDINIKTDGRLSVKWDGYFWPRVSGEYQFEYEYLYLNDAGGIISGPNALVRAEVKLDGKALLHPGVERVWERSPGFFPMEIRRARVRLEAGKAYPISISYAGANLRLQTLRIAVRRPAGSIAAAVQAARGADAAVVFVGSGSTAETEGRDRENLGLYGEQDALVQAVAEANPRTIVVLHNGAPVSMPWIDKVSAVVEAWLPGQEGNLAVADVLFGRINPSGKLPVSFPKRIQDSPSFMFYPGFRDAVYGEGIFMGYRYYDKKELEPLFAFGHGLSYTQFAYSNLNLPKEIRSGQDWTVSVDVKNTGQRAGAEVVQLYASNPNCREACPVRELKAFERVELAPGEARTVTLKLDAQALAHYDSNNEEWSAAPGKYVVAVGGSSRDLRNTGEVQLTR